MRRDTASLKVAVIAPALLVGTGLLSAFQATDTFSTRDRASAVGLPVVSIGSLRSRSDWLAELPDGKTAVDACFSKLPPQDRAALVILVTSAEEGSWAVRFRAGLRPRVRQILCSLTRSDFGSQVDLYYPVSGEWFPTQPPYYTRDASLLPSDPSLTRLRLIDASGAVLGFVAFDGRTEPAARRRR